MKVSKYLVLSDLHVPFHDPLYVRLASKILSMFEFDGLIQLGDALDFWQISRFDKDPTRTATLIDDANDYSAILKGWSKLLKKNGVVHQLCGNHEDRLRRYIWQNAKELHGLVRDVPELIHLRDLPVRTIWHPLQKWDSCKIGDAVLHHGHFFNMHVAVGNLSRYPKKLITGHTHRFQYASNGSIYSVTLGHGSDEALTSHQPTPTNWQQAMAILTVVDGITHIEPVLVSKGSCVLYGEKVVG